MEKRTRLLALALYSLAGVIAGGCGGLADEQLRPVILLTVRGLGDEVAGLRVQATLNNAPQKEAGEFFEGFGAGIVQQQVAVQLPQRAEGEVVLTLTALTQDRCAIGRNEGITVHVEPGALVPFDLALSRFKDNKVLCPVAITRTGGPGRVLSDVGADCSERCSIEVPRGSSMTLSASNDRGTRFLEWEGACTGDRPCSLRVNAPLEVGARFAPTLTVVRKWAGGVKDGAEVRANVGSLSCGDTCVDGVRPGTPVALSVVSGSKPCFVGWGGALCKGIDACKFDMPEQAVEVEAYFLDCEDMSSPGLSGDLSSVWAVSGEAWAAGGWRMTTGGKQYVLSQYTESSGKWSDAIETTLDNPKLWTSGPSSDLWAADYSSSYMFIWRRLGSSWQAASLSTSNYWRAVWGSAANDVWMVGQNAFVHSNGTAIDRSGSFPSGGSYYGVAGSGINDVWAVGSGPIQHWRGGPSWEALSNPATSVMLNAVWAVSPRRAWAVGDKGTILQWDGAKWQPQSSGVTASLYGVWGTSEKDAWAVGELATVLRWDGEQWRRLPALPVSSSVVFSSVHGYDEKSFFAVGSNTTIVRFRR